MDDRALGLPAVRRARHARAGRHRHGRGRAEDAELAGRRPKQHDVDPTINAGWQNTSFKNYADYTLTAGFEAGLKRLTTLAADRHVTIMCGEPMPWRCHRLLIANTLTARGWSVVHLVNNAAPRPHRPGQWGAAPSVGPGGVVTYPPDPAPATGSP